MTLLTKSFEASESIPDDDEQSAAKLLLYDRQRSPMEYRICRHSVGSVDIMVDIIGYRYNESQAISNTLEEHLVIAVQARIPFVI